VSRFLEFVDETFLTWRLEFTCARLPVGRMTKEFITGGFQTKALVDREAVPSGGPLARPALTFEKTNDWNFTGFSRIGGRLRAVRP